MGCTPCKEEQQGAPVDPIGFGTPKQGRTLQGVNRPQSPLASIVLPTDSKMDQGSTPNFSQTGKEDFTTPDTVGGGRLGAPSNTNGENGAMTVDEDLPRIQLVEDGFVEREASASKVGNTGPSSEQPVQVVRYESEPSTSPQQKSKQPFNINTIKRMGSPTPRNGDRLAEWVKQRQAKILEERKQAQMEQDKHTTGATENDDPNKQASAENSPQMVQEEQTMGATENDDPTVLASAENSKQPEQDDQILDKSDSDAAENMESDHDEMDEGRPSKMQSFSTGRKSSTLLQEQEEDNQSQTALPFEIAQEENPFGGQTRISGQPGSFSQTLEASLIDQGKKESLAREFSDDDDDEEMGNVDEDDEMGNVDEDDDNDEEMGDVDEDDGKRMTRTSTMKVTTGRAHQINSITANHRRDNSWKSMPLTRVISFPKVHVHQLELTDMVGQNSPRSKRAKKPEEMTEQEREEAMWLCDGKSIFADGCKSGQTEFDVHADIKCWRCYQQEAGSDEDCDFDFCEMCVRWVIYCERLGIDLELAATPAQQ